ncbi:polyprenyl synthetase family protein [Hydrogenovibrio halophilus]|uniref:polyprenyl synthetase family protein n=1 Tax=Hydrogenovibrio halophilus TaxID=373391 RepID=UPI0003AA4810|nr:farnesyl diphosphate synthase [Hydrogenovibrio halophilus]
MSDFLTTCQQRVNRSLEQTLESAFHSPEHSVNGPQSCPEHLRSALAYALNAPGKRLRAALIFAIGEALDQPAQDLDKLAVAIEMIHAYSLVHDDLPAMDDDNYRRGQLTVHKQFDDATAILVGDALQTLAFETLTHLDHGSAETTRKRIRLFAQSSGLNGMVGGQARDLTAEGQTLTLQQLTQLHQMKTGALFVTACLAGAIGHTDHERLSPILRRYGEALGLAFQVQDDILDIEGDSATLGKPQGSDCRSDKATFVKLMGLDGAKRYRDQFIQQAQAALSELPFQSPFLTDLTDFVRRRTS